MRGVQESWQEDLFVAGPLRAGYLSASRIIVVGDGHAALLRARRRRRRWHSSLGYLSPEALEAANNR
jgi:hypothetical protein